MRAQKLLLARADREATQNFYLILSTVLQK
jgi:hypothetical protein